MKILFLVPYVHSDTLKPFKRFSTGLSFTIESIIRQMSSDGHEVYVYTQSAFCPEYVEDNIHYLPKSFFDLSPFSIRYLKSFFADTKKDKISLKKRLHILAYYLFGRHVEKIIADVKPDIVSIRGIGYSSRPFILACKKTNVKYVVSLHGAISLSDTTNASSNEKRMERDLIRDAFYSREFVTVIASGIKARLIRALQLGDGSETTSNIRVVNNGVDLTLDTFSPDELARLKKLYKIQEKDIVFISAGTLCSRKNQIQIVRAFHLLPENIKNRAKLLLLGKGEAMDMIQDEISKSGEKDRIFVCGYIPISEVQKYYAISHVNVIASVDEGFGRAFIEGFIYGLPSVTFSDLDAVNDLYDECAMVKVDARSDEALSQGLNEAFSREWNRERIKAHGLKFSVKEMVSKYETIYQQLVNMPSNGKQ